MSKEDLIRRAIGTCPLPEALEAVGERWSFLILRGAFSGLSQFEQFQSTLGIARNILANRLARLVEHGILERRPSAEDRRRINYCLTEKGEALMPTLIALRQWGERYGTMPVTPVLVDRRDRRPVAQMRVHAADGRPLTLHELAWVDRADLEPLPVAAE